MRVLMIQRAEQYSPNSVDKDLAILSAVAERLQRRGCEVELLAEEKFAQSSPQCALVLTMGRRPETLAELKTVGCRVINAPEGVENCARTRLPSVRRCLQRKAPMATG